MSERQVKLKIIQDVEPWPTFLNKWLEGFNI